MKVCIIGSYAKALVMTADRIPVAGETLMGRDYRGEFGGKGSDMAVQSSRLGAEVSYIGVIGDDTFGKEFVDLMKDEKIDISGLRITKEKSTGTGFIIKDIEARNVIVVDSGANDLFSKEDIDNAEKLIEEADVVLAQLEIPLDTALYAMKVAKKHGKTRVNENIDDETFGMLFIADINSFEELHSEIEKILISDKLVENWTYPLIQPILIEEAKKRGFI